MESHNIHVPNHQAVIYFQSSQHRNGGLDPLVVCVGKLKLAIQKAIHDNIWAVEPTTMIFLNGDFNGYMTLYEIYGL